MLMGRSPLAKSFNPHTREGVTTMNRREGYNLRRFNPHTREGVTSYDDEACLVEPVSIHTPVRV